MRELFMNGHDQNGHNESFARFVAYSSPYLFWFVVSMITAGIFWLHLRTIHVVAPPSATQQPLDRKRVVVEYLGVLHFADEAKHARAECVVHRSIEDHRDRCIDARPIPRRH